jgi:hypothetical protein
VRAELVALEDLLGVAFVLLEVEGGAVPTAVLGPDDASGVPAVVVVPSVYGAAPDLLERLAELVDSALVCVPDPLWRTGHGPTAYGDMD